MSTSTFDPFRSLDRTFDRLLGDSLRSTAGGAIMPMDLYRSGESFVAHIDLPGVDPGSIDIDVEDRTLTVRAERTAPEEEGAQWLSRERPTGTFARQLSLGRGLALDRIEADYRDGVLSLTIPVAEEAKPRKISVSHGGSHQAIGSGTDKGTDTSTDQGSDTGSDQAERQAG
ncbi:Hsp20/alpha crystallin family protein [Terrabacter sp. MAHUQ-38]|uniref:Hsp20/alpha crystallin family protein n=1 Tax=unclassified Terrabacter TaxID=2630222 RepID=UPI00165D633A|nr:Hsp20/alpha crystallin family protein [Terrabacter sp. MAHUQ-38]MBC9820679.1 Hsp20/alpha crystallin family protein [Terrabacter sp. MAHUQ-38]